MTAAGCCFWAATLEQQALDRRRAIALATSDARGLQSALADVRRALSAMASPGQTAVSWSRQATASIEVARGRLIALMAADGGASLRPHAERLDKLVDAERRLHENAAGGRALMASDVAFGEALPLVDELNQQITDAVGTMTETADRDLAAARDLQLLALAGALGVLGVAAVLLTPVPRRRDDEVAPAVGEEAAETPADGLPLSVPSPPAAGAPPWATPTAASAPVAAAKPVAPGIELSPLAAACDALARLADGDKLPGVLDTVRPALGARGIAVWLVNAEKTTLQVVASSGYERRVVERFPIVSLADDNPTAKAFAGLRTIATPARAGRPAAVTLPIGGARGSSGVLSLEMIGAREADANVVAAAGIVASQLATLLGPLPTVEAAEPEPPAAHVEHG